MTQLDRLEALAKKHDSWGDNFAYNTALTNLAPDLILVARVAHQFADDWDLADVAELMEALTPLYREVES